MKTSEDQSLSVEHWKQRIVSAENGVKTAREHLADVRAEFKATVASLLGTEQIKELLNMLYWETDIPTKELAKVCGLPNMSVFNKQFITPTTVTTTCTKCSKVFIAEAKTKAKKKEWLSKRGGYVCGPCLAKAEAGLKAHTERINSYWERYKDTVRRLKALPYAEYLQTDHWNNVRLRTLKSARYRCQLCNQPGKLHVHHRHYKTLGEEEWRDVIALCSDCQAKFHDKLP